MRIQEMRSGQTHLKKKMAPERENYIGFLDAADEAFDYEDQPVVEAIECELEDARWSVVSFEGRQAGGLTYKQAAELMNQLDGVGISGLCIVADAAAARHTR